MMLRSQLPAATAWHLGNWNIISKNYFLDYTSSLKKMCCDTKTAVKLRAFVKWSLQILPVVSWVFLFLTISLSILLFDSDLGKIRICSVYHSDHEWYLCLGQRIGRSTYYLWFFFSKLFWMWNFRLDSKNSSLEPLWTLCVPKPSIKYYINVTDA